MAGLSMSEPTYQIVFRGKILTGYTREQVRSNLAQLFRTDPARIDALLDAPKTVLKAGIGKDAAARYQEALRQAGIMVAMMAEAPPTAVPAAAPTPATAATPASPVSAAAAPTEATAPATATAPPAVAASGLTLAAPGERILPPQPRREAQIDTSALSLAPAVGPLVEARPVAAPEFDLSGISLATDSGPIDRRPKAAPRQIDTSGLSLDAPPPAKDEEALSELQKLLSSSVD